MKTKDLKETFNELVNTLQRWELYQPEDEVDNALTELSNKINEIEKRFKCITKTVEDIKEQISGYPNRVDCNGNVNVSIDKLHLITRNTNDIIIATNLEDDEPIIETESTEDTVELSGGGIPYRICKHCSIKEEETVMNLIDGVWVCNDCNPPTNLCRVEEIHSIVKDVIAKLNDISVDGETMQYILERVGMDDQMLKQLFGKTTNDELDYLLDVRNGK